MFSRVLCPSFLRSYNMMANLWPTQRARAAARLSARHMDTRDEHEPGTDADTICRDARIDGSLILAEFPSELLVVLAEALGNPLSLLVSKAHLSKAFREAAGAAQASLKHADLCEWARTVDDAVVASVLSSAPSSPR